MDIKIELKIVAPELYAALLALADALPQVRIGTFGVLKEAEALNPAGVNAEEVEKETGGSSENQEAVTLEKIKALFAALGEAGLQTEARALLQTFGTTKLKDVKVEDYSQLYEKADKLCKGTKN